MGRIFQFNPGKPFPLGATPKEGGVNFAIYSANASSIELLLFEKGSDPVPCQIIQLDPSVNRSHGYWHVFVEGLTAAYRYGYRVSGSWDPKQGYRFTPQKVLVDPYAKALDYSVWDRESSYGDGDNGSRSIRSVIVEAGGYDWEGDHSLNIPLAETVIYETHIGNFTKSPTSTSTQPGTYQAFIEKVPYLKSLGITAVELMPVCDFSSGPVKNVWGYGSLTPFALEGRYSGQKDPEQHLNEFRSLVKACHQAGIEVILDMVFGYTTEDGENGPTLSFRGIDNTTYYQLDQADKSRYLDFSGCHNTLNCNHPVVSGMIRDALIYWVKEAHVDGFRLDEASILNRDEHGQFLKHPFVLQDILLAPELHDTKLFVEPWDASRGYLLGRFPGDRFIEWNDQFRDGIRRFVRGEPGLIKQVADYLAGSRGLYQDSGKIPLSIVNFITCHDGFTLRDLVSYDHKHNDLNYENNHDGLDENYSCNYGTEGETSDPALRAERLKQMKNFLVLLFLANGTPLLSMGDEVGRSQRGNNNAYCEDNETVWLNWSRDQDSEELQSLTKQLITLRKRYIKLITLEAGERILHGCKLECPGLSDPSSRVLSYTLNNLLHVAINMEESPLEFEIPSDQGRGWRIEINTANPVNNESLAQGKLIWGQDRITVGARSIVVLALG